ncbi:hypothetical protein WH47_01109 [Habropoda laboriosa]|uniref:Uncharacterized protein n=1 Tax=Habropoda laboriosa TaxID=597456 RepID=A0A0L7QYS4_9HYME|nr:hypothetical protein WH47_01109 [Habropoda laboriosa]
MGGEVGRRDRQEAVVSERKEELFTYDTGSTSSFCSVVSLGETRSRAILPNSAHANIDRLNRTRFLVLYLAYVRA